MMTLIRHQKRHNSARVVRHDHRTITTFGLLTTLIVLLILPGILRASDGIPGQPTEDSLSLLMKLPVAADVSLDSTASLDDFLVLAMKRNPGLRAAYEQWIADMKRTGYVGGLPDPVLSYGYFVEHVETRVGPQQQRFSLRQSFPWFGTLGARRDIATAMSNASYRKFEAARLRLFYQVKAAYADYYYLGRELHITRDNLELLTFWESVARTRYEVGLQKHPDIIKAQVELGKLEDRVRTLEYKRTPIAARLRSLLNLPPNAALPMPSRLPLDESSLNSDSLLAVIIANNPDLDAVRFAISQAEAGERLAGKQAMPEFSISVDYIQTGEALNPTMPESGKDPWMISASLSLPIWFGKNSARTDEARARRRAAEYTLEDARNQLTALAEQAVFDYTDARRKLRLYRDGLVPKAEQSLNVTYAAYRAGNVDFLSLLDAQRQLLEFELTVAREQASLATARARLEMLSGSELTTHVQE
ncbi:TolC family protein [bacterium]|nr:TolC family protein [bacterium]